MDDLAVRVGQNIRRLRLEKKLSQEALARKAGVHSKYLGEIERAKKHITVERLHQITMALEITLSTFFEAID